MTKFEPLGEKVLVEPMAAETKIGSIIIPEIGQEAPQQGTVLAVGKDARLLLSPGDVVMYGKYAGLTIKIDGKDLLIMDIVEVFGKVTDSGD